MNRGQERIPELSFLLPCWCLLALALLTPLSALTATWVFAARESRPFWAEKSTFIEGEELFVVGVASKAHSAEEGRQQAFEHGKTELMNYAQITSLEEQGLVIETQMTYEEVNADGSLTVFRLLRVPVTKLQAIQGRVQAQTRAQEQVLDRTRRELIALQQSLAQKQMDLETRTQQVQATLDTVSRLQATLGEKAMKIERQQREVEQLIQQLANKIQTSPPQSAEKPGAKQRSGDSLIGTLKNIESQLDAQEAVLAEVSRRARSRITKEVETNRMKCKYVLKGMTKEEVGEVMGEPDHRAHADYWRYGKRDEIAIHFNDMGGVDDIRGCPKK